MEQLNKADIRKEQHYIMVAALNSMQKQMFLTDVVITCMDQELSAHRVILSAGSPYFRAMFSNNVLEANSGKVEFEHITLDTMQVILEFLYSGHIADIENDIEKVKDILGASHLLQLELVYEYCWKVLQDSLSIAQCFELWELAELYQHKNMNETIIKYMVENFRSVMASSEFLTLPTDKIAILLKHPILDTPSDELVKKLIEWAKHNGNNERKKDLMILLDYVDFDSLSNEFISHASEDDFIKTSSSVLCKLLSVAMSRTAVNSQVAVDSGSSHSSVNAVIIFFEPNYLYTLNLKTEKWKRVELLPFQLERGMTSVLDGNNAYFLGGGGSPKNATSNALKYNMMTNSSTILHSFQYNRFCPGATKLGPKLYVLGGKNRNCDSLRDVEVYNSSEDVWTSVARTSNAYYCPKVVTMDGSMLVVGCYGEGVIEMYREITNQWSCVVMPKGIAWPLRVARHKQIIWVVDCVRRMAYRYNVKHKSWLSKRIEGTNGIVEICSAVDTVEQGPVLIALDQLGVLYSLDPCCMEAICLATNIQLRTSDHLGKWVHLQ